MSERRTFIKKLSGLGLGVFSSWEGIRMDRSALAPDSFWSFVQKQFPITHVKTYFNTGTMGPSPYGVLDRVRDHNTWMETNGEYKGTEEARNRLAQFLGCLESEISLTHNTTEGINIMAWGLSLKPGDEVILSTHEHVGNALPWLNRAKLEGIRLIPIVPGLTQEENYQRVKAAIGPRTRVIALPHITTTTGTLFPIQAIAELARRKNIWTCIDGAHAPGSVTLNLHNLNVDCYAASCHKWMCGPNGTGFLYVKENMLDALQVFHVGAYSDTGWEISPDNQTLKGYNPTAHRYDFATQNAALYQGVVAAIDFLESVEMKKVSHRVRDLSTHLFEELDKIKRVNILTPREKESRAGMVSFTLEAMDFREFGKRASAAKFRIRLVPESGLDAIRISTHIFNDHKQIDSFVKLVREL
ncbi:MAG: aminotransferase class V-fold PLP-dependent enzyme [Bacteroidota bacterium]